MTDASTSFRASKLTEEQAQEARALKSRMEAWKSDSGMTQVQFADITAFPGGPAMISQNLSGKRPISIDQAVAYARGFACEVKDISPTLAAKYPQEGLNGPLTDLAQMELTIQTQCAQLGRLLRSVHPERRDRAYMAAVDVLIAHLASPAPAAPAQSGTPSA